MLVRVSGRKIILKQLAFMVIPCVLTIVLVVVSIININNTVEAKNRKLFSTMAFEIRMLLDNIISESNAIMYSFSTDSSFFTNLQTIFEHSSISYENLMLFRAYQNSLDIAVKTRPYIESLYCIPLIAAGNQPVVSAGDGVTALDGFGDRNFIESCINDPSIASSYVYRDKNYPATNSLKTYVLSRNQRVTTVDKTRSLGDLIINLDVKYIGKLISNLLEPEAEVLYAITLGNNQIIWASALVARNPELLDSDFNSDSGSRWKVIEGKKYTLVESLSLNGVFEVSIFASKEALLLSDRSLVVSTLLIIFTSIVIGIVVIVLYTRKKYEDVALFSDYLNAIDTEGAFSPVPVPEVELTNMDANVVKEFMLKDYIKLHISQRELKERTLELEMLRKQLNPHFLLNTMQMLNWRIMRELNGYNELNLIVENLTKILSYSLHPTDFLATFGEERQYTDAYVCLLNRIADTTTQLVWLIPDDMQSFSIPRQLFQPLVENALKHAFGSLENDHHPEIIIKAERFHDDMMIVITDNGMGIDPQEVSRLNAGFEEESLEQGIGLSNTNKRIKLLFGTRFGLRITSALGLGTTIEIRLPRIVWKETPNAL